MTNHRIVSLHAGYDRSNGAFVDGFLARPAAGGQWPGVVLLSGMSGVNWFQRQVTRAFARAGFVAISPDIINGAHPTNQTAALLVKNSVDLDTAVDIAANGARFLHDLPWVGPRKIGVVGFCLGGGLAILALARTDAFRAGVIYYQSLFPDSEELQHIHVPMLCHYGTADHSTPREEVEAFRETLERYEKQFTIHFYDGMPHSFVNTERNPLPGQREAAEESLQRSFRFLHERLGSAEER